MLQKVLDHGWDVIAVSALALLATEMVVQCTEKIVDAKIRNI